MGRELSREAWTGSASWLYTEYEKRQSGAQLLSIFIAFYNMFSSCLNKSSQSGTSDCISLEMQTFVLLVLYTKEQRSPKCP